MDDIQPQLYDLIRSYKMPRVAFELLSAHKPMILAGVTGSGKNVIAEAIQAMSDWQIVVTHTTRQPRAGEQNGKNYWYVSQDEMIRLINQQAFIEVKWIHAHQIYGSSIAAYNSVLESGHQPMLHLDVQGIETILSVGIDIRPFFILPPSFDAWMERLDNRGHMSHVERLKRIASAKIEIDIAINNDKYTLVVNDDINRVAQEILQGASDATSQHERQELAKQLIEHIQHY